MRLVLTCAVAWTMAVAMSLAGEVSFSAKPAASKDGDKVKISFTVSAPTDVEVAVLDSAGKIVCHLAAGVLGGPKPPPEPLKAGLVQEIVWDGKDDFGRQVSGVSVQVSGNQPDTRNLKPETSFRVRVRAGTKTAFDGFVGASPYALCTVRYSPVRGMVLDAGGNLYVREEAYNGGGSTDIRVFDRTGKYLRTVMPYPANLKKEDAAPFGLVPAPGDALVPRNQGSLWAYTYETKPKGYSRSYGPLNFKLQAITPDGVLLLLDESFRAIARVRAADGGAVGGVFGESIWPQGDKRFPDYSAIGGSPAMVLAADGKTLYLVGKARGPDKGQKLNPDLPDGRVYKGSLDKIGQGLETFADIAMPEKLRAPEGGWAPGMATAALQGVTVDAKGNVYVCDLANGAVHRFDSAGKETGTLAFPGAQQAVVDDKTGAIYVINRSAKVALAKFAACEAGAKELARLEFQGTTENQQSFLVVDFGAAKPQVWLANVNGRRQGHGLLRIEDEGAAFKVLEDLSERDPSALRGVDRIVVDPETDDVYVSNGWIEILRYSGLTGKYNGAVKDGRADPIIATDVAVSPDGFVYIQDGRTGFSGVYKRMDRNLKPAPLAAAGSDIIGWVFGRYGQGYCTKGTAIGWDGRIYSFGMLAWCEYYLSTYDREGRFQPGPRVCTSQIERLKTQPDHGDLKPLGDRGINSALIGPVTAGCGGVKVDRSGFVYLGLNVLPEGFKPPAGFESDGAYLGDIGSVVKFKPDGGGLAKGKRQDRLADYEGVVQAYPGFGSFSGGGKGGGGCVCRSPRFDLDPYGRLCIPNTSTFDVRVLDNAGNEITKFGAYGNFDSQWVPEGSTDKKPLVATPEIPLGWPLSAGASEKKIYVGDLYNRRVVRVDKKFAAEEVCELRAVPEAATK